MLAACRPAPIPELPAAPAPTMPSPAVTALPATSTAPQGATLQPDDLDLRFANVIDVAFEQIDENLYRFDVTLYHDDVGEAPQYADAWQVEDPDGEVLGIRQLLHSHGTQPFTRSQAIEVPAEVSRVIVRGHDMAHGFGGQAIEVDLLTGELIPFQTSPSE